MCHTHFSSRQVLTVLYFLVLKYTEELISKPTLKLIKVYLVPVIQYPVFQWSNISQVTTGNMHWPRKALLPMLDTASEPLLFLAEEVLCYVKLHETINHTWQCRDKHKSRRLNNDTPCDPHSQLPCPATFTFGEKVRENGSEIKADTLLWCFCIMESSTSSTLKDYKHLST